MVTRTFLSKCTTIFEGSKDNFGLHPVAMLNYGQVLSRAMVYFDMDNIEKIIKEEGYAQNKLTHTLKLTNCGNTDTKGFEKPLPSEDLNGEKYRATSFSVLVFRVPEKWDAGRGFDKSDDFWLLGKQSVSQQGANWFYAYNGKKWGVEKDESGKTIYTKGIISIDRLSEELDKYNRGEESLIVNTQHFDHGNENFNIDITSYVNGVLENKFKNFGLAIAFTPLLEESADEITKYVGFFTNNTNTFFAPYVETRCYEAIEDTRYSFYSGIDNKLYFYAILGGIPVDLDEVPTCTIDGVKYPVFRQNTGIYFANVKINSEKNTILYDNWGNLKYKGENIDDVELEFEVMPRDKFFVLGDKMLRSNSFDPSLSGINDNEKVYQGDERTIDVIFRIPYTNNYEIVNTAEYRIYVKDGKREIDVIDWDKINLSNDRNFFKIKTQELLPSEYHIDIRTKIGMDMRIFKDKLTFKVVDNATELKI